MTSITAAHSKQKGMIHLDLFSWDNNVKKLFPKQNTCFCGVEHLTLMGFFYNQITRKQSPKKI